MQPTSIVLGHQVYRSSKFSACRTDRAECIAHRFPRRLPWPDPECRPPPLAVSDGVPVPLLLLPGVPGVSNPLPFTAPTPGP